jgi:hypothetical protein
MLVQQTSPLWQLRCRLPHKGGDWARRLTSPLVGEGPRSCAAEGGSLERRGVAQNFAEADRIRDELLAQGIQLKDSKDSVTGERVTAWEVKR